MLIYNQYIVEIAVVAEIKTKEDFKNDRRPKLKKDRLATRALNERYITKEEAYHQIDLTRIIGQGYLHVMLNGEAVRYFPTEESGYYLVSMQDAHGHPIGYMQVHEDIIAEVTSRTVKNQISPNVIGKGGRGLIFTATMIQNTDEGNPFKKPVALKIPLGDFKVTIPVKYRDARASIESKGLRILNALGYYLDYVESTETLRSQVTSSSKKINRSHIIDGQKRRYWEVTASLSEIYTAYNIFDVNDRFSIDRLIELHQQLTGENVSDYRTNKDFYNNLNFAAQIKELVAKEDGVFSFFTLDELIRTIDMQAQFLLNQLYTESSVPTEKQLKISKLKEIVTVILQEDITVEEFLRSSDKIDTFITKYNELKDMEDINLIPEEYAIFRINFENSAEEIVHYLKCASEVEGFGTNFKGNSELRLSLLEKYGIYERVDELLKTLFHVLSRNSKIASSFNEHRIIPNPDKWKIDQEEANRVNAIISTFTLDEIELLEHLHKQYRNLHRDWISNMMSVLNEYNTLTKLHKLLNDDLDIRETVISAEAITYMSFDGLIIPALVLPYMQGYYDLRDCIFDENNYLALAERVAQTVDALNIKGGLIHKDLTDGNIMYNIENETMLLIDFGTSRFIKVDLKDIFSNDLPDALRTLSDATTGRSRAPEINDIFFDPWGESVLNVDSVSWTRMSKIQRLQVLIELRNFLSYKQKMDQFALSNILLEKFPEELKIDDEHATSKEKTAWNEIEQVFKKSQNPNPAARFRNCTEFVEALKVAIVNLKFVRESIPDGTLLPTVENIG